MKQPDYHLAKAVEEAVVNASNLAYSLLDADSEKSIRWMRHSDMLEQKYQNAYGEHYSVTVQRGG